MKPETSSQTEIDSTGGRGAVPAPSRQGSVGLESPFMRFARLRDQACGAGGCFLGCMGMARMKLIPNLCELKSSGQPNFMLAGETEFKNPAASLSKCDERPENACRRTYPTRWLVPIWSSHRTTGLCLV